MSVALFAFRFSELRAALLAVRMRVIRIEWEER